MQIFATEQIRAWDEYTIRHEPIASVDLMERAATACYDWLLQNNYKGKAFTIFCGKGNNGGDGLVIARLLAQTNHAVTVNILEFGHKGTVDFQINLARLHNTTATIRFVSSEETVHPIPTGDVVIDALLGSGINRPADGLTAHLIQHINNSNNEVIAIDIPSGLFVDHSSRGNIVIKARYTLSFQCFKPAFLMPENAAGIGDVHLLNIGLLPGFLAIQDSPFQLVDQQMAQQLLQPRKPFSHKGDYGHAAIIAGSYGMMGAAVLCARACLRSGVGKLTCHVPAVGYNIMQTSVPEGMCKTGSPGENDNTGHATQEMDKYDTIGIGPGLGPNPANVSLLYSVFEQNRRPMVIDADGLNAIAREKALLNKIPLGSILTPHPKEFERLFGKTANDYDRIQLALQTATDNNLYIVLKGRYSFIASPDGKGYFNSTGNPGMASGGTGDVLTGMITGLLAQQYSPLHAAILGVFLHGRAGDLAAAYASQPSLIASDLVDFLGQAYQSL
ncbi:NAD(P)H-hydrate epimerase [Niastella koreensis]|uniref:Bifunctional NAD(P)H-hydrate repair enzyme n=2 Tax=Niastella koreensis TaxID=354356 RepID=G8TAL0_NIAKG|nr:bifunctional ADP-dependent NAD(P)H-hydrate dehydratase/NAD(P)H-hydrate epimerase [Niastella koreensis]AEV98172.1 YjeF-related protein [Niastella koreensis GR20-10]OQP45377.1 NAD(P)H-hydrate epimerase [Niastella koreensis]